MRIELPFPPAVLSPNNRSCWQKKARIAKRFKNDCLLLLSPQRKTLTGMDNFRITFIVPDNRKRDLDNMIAASKNLLDAISAVTGVDDSNFKLTFAKSVLPVKGGAVIVEAA